MNNLSSCCGLVDAKIRAFDKDLPVLKKPMYVIINNNNTADIEMKKKNHSILKSRFKNGTVWKILIEFYQNILLMIN